MMPASSTPNTRAGGCVSSASGVSASNAAPSSVPTA